MTALRKNAEGCSYLLEYLSAVQLLNIIENASQIETRFIEKLFAHFLFIHEDPEERIQNLPFFIC